MTSRRILAPLAVCALLAAGAPALPAAAAEPDYGSKTVTYRVGTDGDPMNLDATLFLEVVHPTLNGEIVQAPVVLTYSPYSVLGRNGDAPRWTERGIARAYADVIGTGNSGGCYDYGGNREKRTGYDLVEYVGTQPWSSGKVGMLGGSYDGTTQYAAAIEKPPHLTTIIPNVAISRWYGYAYSGGMRYTYTNEEVGPQGPGAATGEGFDTPLAFDFGFAVPPPADVENENFTPDLVSTLRPCQEAIHTEKGYDLTPDYDSFWQERDYTGGLADVDIPVLITGNWGDWNVKQEESLNAYRALVAGGNDDTHLYMGSRWRGHGSPAAAAAEPMSEPGATPRDTYSQTVQKWMEHYLLGVDNGIQTLPDVLTQTADSTGALLRYTDGPFPQTTDVPLIAGRATGGDYPWVLGPGPSPGDGTPAEFTMTGLNQETKAAAAYRAGNGYLAFETAPLARDVRIVGNPQVKLFNTVQREFVTLTPSLLDVNPAEYTGSGATLAPTDPDGLVGVTRGWRDSRYSDDGRQTPGVRQVGQGALDTITQKPVDYTFRAGNRIVLLVQTETADWTILKPPPACVPSGADPTCTRFEVGYDEGQTQLVLPVVGGSTAAELFQPPNPEPVIPEVPSAALLPLAALTVLGAGAVLRRRRLA